MLSKIRVRSLVSNFAILEQKFEKAHVVAILKHFVAAKIQYQEGDWETAILAAGKLVEATTKALLRFCGKILSRGRKFHAGTALRGLERESSSIDDTVIDAGVTDVSISWVLGELIRFSSKRNKNPKEAQELVEALTGKTYLIFEEINGRFYVNMDGLSAEKTALLILYGLYPSRIREDFLRESVMRHGFSKKNANMAFRRVKHLCDTDGTGLKPRGLGRQKAEKVLDESRPRRPK